MSDREKLPYGRQTITEDDVRAVVEVLRSEWLTTGPRVEAFEKAFADFSGAQHAVAVSSGTAALHAATHAMRIGPGDEVIVPAITFAATPNAVVYCGGTPVFADVQPGSLLIDPESVLERITDRTRGVIAVDYAGQPCDYADLHAIVERHNLFLAADGCHAPGAAFGGKTVGTLAELTTFSFHPVKHITTGEGGMVTTDNPVLAQRMRQFRNHGISTDFRERVKSGVFAYEMVELGFNYRLSDIHCALGLSQLKSLPSWLEQRRRLAERYDARFKESDAVKPLELRAGRTHAYHLYVVRIKSGRDEMFRYLREAGIGANVHYLPVYLHPFYREKFGYEEGLCAIAEAAYQEILSLPLYPQMSFDDVDYVADNVLNRL